MSRQGKRPKSSKSQKRRSETGIKTGKYEQLELLRVIDGMISIPSSVQVAIQESESSTPESVLISRNQTLSDKPTTCNPCLPMENLSRKSGQDLITSAKVFYPFWDKSCQEMSEKLWSATKTDLSGLVLTSSNGSVNKKTANSWFSTEVTYLMSEKWLRIFLPSSMSSVADCMDSESTSLLSKKIRVYPETALAKIWFQWISASRWCFNQAIAILKTQKIGKYDLRKTVMGLAPEWVSQAPYNPRQLAVFQAYEAHKAAKKSGGDAKFRSVREPVKSIRFQKDNWKKKTFYPTQTKGLSFQASEPIIDKMHHEPTLVLDRGRWFICYAVDEPKPKPLNSQLAIALDPGVRTFLTGFDGSEIWEIGKSDMGRIYRLASHLDKLMSRVGLSKGRQFKRLRYRLRKAAQKIRVKIRNLVSELHKKAANYLCTKYKVIFLPTFEVKNMVKRGKRRLNTKTARKLVTWSHYRFKMALKHQAAKYGCVVVDVTEEYTSKTCSKCGHIHTKLGGNKKFTCPSCGHTIARDINGAFNILLKALRDTSTSGVIASFQIVPHSETSGNCQIFPG